MRATSFFISLYCHLKIEPSPLPDYTRQEDWRYPGSTIPAKCQANVGNNSTRTMFLALFSGLFVVVVPIRKTALRFARFSRNARYFPIVYYRYLLSVCCPSLPVVPPCSQPCSLSSRLFPRGGGERDEKHCFFGIQFP